MDVRKNPIVGISIIGSGQSGNCAHTRRLWTTSLMDNNTQILGRIYAAQYAVEVGLNRIIAQA
jgi:hypothetical protein